MVATPEDRIIEAQGKDSFLQKIKNEIGIDKRKDFRIASDRALMFKGRICVPMDEVLKKEILEEAHITPYIAHLDVKAEHQRPAGLLNPLDIPEWKWENITMDFVVGFSRSVGGHNAIWVIVDRLTKSAHFLPVEMTFSLDQLARLYIKEIVRLRCRSPVHRDEVGEKRVLGLEIIERTVEAIDKIRTRIKAVQDRQKSYADIREKDLEFQVRDKVFLKVAPIKGVLRFDKKGKLQPHYIGPFEILDGIESVAYRLALPPELSSIHNLFHISMVKKYMHDLDQVVNYQSPDVCTNLSYEDYRLEYWIEGYINYGTRRFNRSRCNGIIME
ncbi:uncharacterized protein LOC111409405 [Olea europaea var. sylvestris]|uniref:uncharacterized protein LOC111409405 n=1 Tax=Olea europaea var. sylvestris TaxID=158386 RepID=UPI000C1D4C60|nr:uncharacterized protein LOC111409405 [Olea europaea var. sylvestris]